MRIPTLAALVTLLPAIAFGAPPRATITGPQAGRPGDLIVLDSSGSEGEHRIWKVWIDLAGNAAARQAAMERLADSLRKAGYVVTAPVAGGADKSLSVDAGAKLVLASYPGTYRAALAVSNAEGVDMALWTVVIVRDGDDPPPPDDDPPPDDPDPPAPPAPLGITEAVPGWLAKVDAAKRGQRSVIATAYRGVGEKAIDGQYATAAEVQAAAKDALSAVAGQLDKKAWAPFGSLLTDAFNGLTAAGKIKTAQDYGRALIEVAEGLR